jgi:hypothetical protein
MLYYWHGPGTKNYEELLKLMPFGWKQKTQELGGLQRLWKIKDAKESGRRLSII